MQNDFVKNSVSIVLLLFLVVICCIVGVQIGSFETTFSDVVSAFFQYDAINNLHFSIVNLRLPRIILALVTGASLAMAGYVLQVLLNNPLAEPYIIGTSAGASLGANIAYFGFFPMVIFGIYTPPLFALVGAIFVTIFVILIAAKNKVIIPTFLILAGIALNTFIGAIISLLTFLSDSDGKLRSIIFWMMGGFEKAGWNNIWYPLVALIVVGILFNLMYKHLTILMIGEEQAENVGLNVNKTRWIFLIGSAVLIGFTVAVSGPIGFVGLIIPHFVKSIWGATGRLNLVFSMLLGGLMLLICDIVSRIILFPSGVPVGIITSFLGVPFFIYLLTKKNYRF